MSVFTSWIKDLYDKWRTKSILKNHAQEKEKKTLVTHSKVSGKHYDINFARNDTCGFTVEYTGSETLRFDCITFWDKSSNARQIYYIVYTLLLLNSENNFLLKTSMQTLCNTSLLYNYSQTCIDIPLLYELYILYIPWHTQCEHLINLFTDLS